MITLREAREEKNLTRPDLAEMVGLSYKTIWEVETKPGNHSYPLAVKIALAVEKDIVDLEEFNGIEKPGDPCLCGCGGVFKLPLRPYKNGYTVKLDVGLPCRDCGKHRSLKHGDPHPQLCNLCWHWRRSIPVLNQEWYDLLLAALRHKHISLGEACRKAGVDRSSIRNWANSKHRPRNPEIVKRLAEIVECPELVGLLDPHKPKRVVVTCPNPENRPDCKGVRYYRPGDLKAQLKNSPGNSADIDWDAGVGPYLCGVCAPGATVQDNLADFHRDMSQHYVSKEDGAGGLQAYYRDQGKRVGASTTGEEKAEARELALEAKKVLALEGERGNPAAKAALEKASLNNSAARLNPTPTSREWGYCRLCPFLVEGQRRGYPTEVHMECLKIWLSDNKKEFSDENNYPPRPRGRRLSPADLALSYELCVRHLIKKEAIVAQTTPEIPNLLMRLEERAREENNPRLALTQDTIDDRIRNFLERLPTDGRGTGRLTRISTILLKAAKAQGYVIRTRAVPGD